MLLKLVATDSGIAARHNKSETCLLGEEILLSEIAVVERIAGDNKRITLADKLDGLLVGSNNGQNVVLIDKVGSTELVTLGKSNYGSSVEGTIVLFF